MLARIEHPELRDRVFREFAGHDPASVMQPDRFVPTLVAACRSVERRIAVETSAG